MDRKSTKELVYKNAKGNMVSVKYVYNLIDKIFDFIQKKYGKGSNSFLTPVMFLDIDVVIKEEVDNEYDYLKTILDENKIYYTEWDNEVEREIRIENYDNKIVPILKKYFNIVGDMDSAEYFIFWSEK